MGKSCCGFGNRNASETIMPKIMAALEYAVGEGCDTFYLGEMGCFDSMMFAATRELKKKYPHIERILVIPYITKYHNEHKREYEQKYDCLILPPEMLEVPPKFAILRKNEWVIDRSDIVLTYARNPYGGAGKAAEYAARKKKFIIDIKYDEPLRIE